MNGKTTIALFAIACVLGVLCILKIMTGDRIPPEITVPAGDLIYTQGEDTGALVAGASAYDNTDGDISDNIRIYDIAVMENGVQALVTYAVYDSSYNLGKATKIVNYVAVSEDKAEDGNEDEEKETDLSEEEDVHNSDADAREHADADEVTTEEEPVGEGYDDPPLVSNGAPVIRLTTHELKLPVGGYFYSMDYVETAVDDMDTLEYLYRNMYLEGDYDVNVPGEYELTYYCVDSGGNVSNMAKLKLIVGDNTVQEGVSSE